MAFDAQAVAALLDPSDPIDQACAGCGAYAGEECRAGCTAAPALAVELDAPDALAGSPQGRIALAVARDLAAAGMPGNPHASLDAGSNVTVVLQHPSGRDWIVASVVVWEHGPVFHIAEYADGDDLWIDTRDAFSGHAAARAIIDLAARRGGAGA